MREVKPWALTHMEAAFSICANRSKDPSTQVGAVIVDRDNNTVSNGYNGFAPGLTETPDRWQRPVKYDYVIHAELNAIARAAKRGVATKGTKMYVTAFPCNDCAKAIIASGIETVYFDRILPGWEEKADFTKNMLKEAGVTYIQMTITKEV